MLYHLLIQRGMIGLIGPNILDLKIHLSSDLQKGAIILNAKRRKSLKEIREKISELKDQLEMLREEEEEYTGNMPENLWGSKHYEKSQEYIDDMSEAEDSLESAINLIESVVDM
ncbi:hypothetical protein [Enterococcus gallinarum]|uniref:hypothetical protein n=1 Tax=Enterococcus gallinarum TaxID=1353 RepID=UPI001D15E7DB|nr:hypothetical protein [Enterococcus gallinarum]